LHGGGFLIRVPTYILIVALVPLSSARGGVHYSGEQVAELPAQWRGYLVDQRALRMLAASPAANAPALPLRESYRAERDRLVEFQTRGARPLTADENSDLGALYIRLGEPDKAVALLREGLRRSPKHFATAANLGMACQLAGDLDQAAAALEMAVALAPDRWKRAEELQLKLVRLRRAENKGATKLDALFAKDTLPPDAVSLVQTLGLWLPADGRVLWQIGEVAHATGDRAAAASILDGCVTEFGMDDRELRARRTAYRAESAAPLAKADVAAVHEGHKPDSQVRFKSARPLIRKAESLKLPPVTANGLNTLPWHVLAETTLDRPFRPSFAAHLRELDGKRVVLHGFVQPTGDGIDQIAVLLIEYPVGCWFCEVPEPTGILLVEPPAGKTVKLTRELVRVEGRIKLNFTDPEEFLYTIREAKVGPPE
jgi:tetratricopeptide (TPR) repeat protein